MMSSWDWLKPSVGEESFGFWPIRASIEDKGKVDGHNIIGMDLASLGRDHCIASHIRPTNWLCWVYQNWGGSIEISKPYMLNIYNCSNIKCNILAGLAGWDNLRRFPIVVHVIMVYVGLSQQPENQFACPNPAALDIRDKAWLITYSHTNHACPQFQRDPNDGRPNQHPHPEDLS